jgi:hypothetical protein
MLSNEIDTTSVPCFLNSFMGTKWMNFQRNTGCGRKSLQLISDSEYMINSFFHSEILIFIIAGCSFETHFTSIFTFFFLPIQIGETLCLLLWEMYMTEKKAAKAASCKIFLGF